VVHAAQSDVQLLEASLYDFRSDLSADEVSQQKFDKLR
jgi:hypothetical protein